MIQDIYHFNTISDQISTGGMPDRGQFFDIAREGFKVVIDLSLDESTGHLPDEAELVRSLGMQYHHIPVIWESPELENLKDFFVTMNSLEGLKVFVHCVANYRASVFTYLYRILQLGENPTSAREDLLKIWQPDQVWNHFIQKAEKMYTSGGK
jgi:protein tyrosine phosphatase (PTP) superfamily phosphohydrolase (DUF442 family)